MNKNILLLSGLVIAIIIIGGLVWNSKKQDSTAMMKVEESMAPVETTTTSDETMMMEGKKTENYIQYSPDAVKTAAENGGKPVLFFYASWCPTCQAADKAFLSSLDQIPAGVTILKVNYDTESELKAKYGITYQHTFVQVDGSGTELSKWNGGDIDNLKSHLK
jgi:thiol-disulfide isomerase/thioredoxin